MSENKRIANTRLREGERIDELQRNGYVIIQDPKRFCFGMDAVLLSGFAQVNKTVYPELSKSLKQSNFFMLWL